VPINTTYQQYGIFTSEEPMSADLINAYRTYHIRDILSLDRDSAKRVSQRINDMSGKNRRLFHHMMFHINPGSPAGEASTLFNNIMDYIPGTPQRPILIHCRAGKDRVGFAVASWLIKVKRHEPCQTIKEVEKNIGYGTGGISPVAKASMDRVLGCVPKTKETVETNQADDVVSAVKDLGYGQGSLVSTTNSDGGFWADNIGFGNQWIDPLKEKYPTPKTAASYWGKKASGIIFICLEDNTILLLKRSEYVHMGGNWGVAGGAVKELGDHYSDSEENLPDPEINVFINSAEEEVREELGSLPTIEKKLGETTFSDGGFTYKTFIYNITKNEKERWAPMIKLNWENDDYQWFPLNQLPGNLHPGLSYTIGELKKQQTLFNNKIARRRFINRLLKIADQLPGGLSDNSKKHFFDPKQIEKGIKIEKEHTPDLKLRKEITEDHLTENDKYYDYLEEMEKKMEEDKNDAFLGGGPPGSPYAESLPAGLIPGYIEKAEIRRKRREKLMKLLEEKEQQNPPHQPKGISDVGLGRTYDGGQLSNTFMTPSGASGSPNAASNSESAGYVQL